jgi:hypothetical protein
LPYPALFLAGLLCLIGREESLNFDGRWYSGEWKAGKKHGHGKLVDEDGLEYEAIAYIDPPFELIITIYGRITLDSTPLCLP